MTLTHGPNKDISRQGFMQIVSMTSAYRVTRLTLTCVVSVMGPSSILCIPHSSGTTSMDLQLPLRMVEGRTLTFLKYFMVRAKCPKEKPCLLCSQAILPPHSAPISYSLLTALVYGLMKRHITIACHTWMEQPLQNYAIYDVPGIVSTAYPLASNAMIVQSGFRIMWIFSYNKDMFLEKNFSLSYVTDWANPVSTANLVAISDELWWIGNLPKV